jgi:hypothetical protein
MIDMAVTDSAMRKYRRALVAAVLALPATAQAESWLDGPRYGRIGTMEAPRAHAEPRAPIESGRAIFNSDAYALQHGFDLLEIDHYAFVPLHKDGIFNFEPDALIYVPPSPGSHSGAMGRVSHAPMAVWLRPNYSLYGFRSQQHGDDSLLQPLAPTESRLRGVSPRILDFERRR